MARKSDAQMLRDAVNLLNKEGYTVVKPNYHVCTSCGKEKSTKQFNFYKTNSRLYTDILPVCKSCLEQFFSEYMIDTKKNEKLSMYLLCREVNFYWGETLWEATSNSNSHRYKSYLRQLNSLPQYSGLTFKDSDEYVGDSEMEDESEIDGAYLKKREKKEAILRWGTNWSEFELMKLEEFYHNMKRANKIETPQDVDYLKKLARLSVKIDNALDTGDGNAKQLGDLYSKFMTDSKFRAMDMTDADKQGGIRTFSQIFEEVEREGFIPPWEKYAKKLGVKQDVFDKAIMHIENFTLRFNNAERMITPPSDLPKIEEE